MEEEEKINPLYKKGFEHGYWLKRGDSPELDGIIKRNNHAEYGAGLKDGQKEAIREQTRERISRINQQNTKDRDREIGE